MLQTIRLPRQSERLAWLAEPLPALPGYGVIYTPTVRDAVRVAEWLRSRAPEWVTCIPSRRHPHLVPDFAERLAAEMGLPFHPTLSKTEDRAEQKSMANSVQQARNVDGSLAVSLEPLPGGPVLLVDDMVDSRWTLTVAAWLLRSNGSGEVWPLALAVAGQGR